MKKKIIFALGCFLTLLTSCVDLDQHPKSWLTEEEYLGMAKDAASVEKAASGLYGNFWGNNYGYCTYSICFGMGADQLTCKPPVSTNRLHYFMELNPREGGLANDIARNWSGYFWPTITSANKILNNTPVLEDVEEAKKAEKALGEVHFMRALAYFHLVRYYGDMPIIRNEVEGITSPQRAPVAEVYDKIIIPDLLEAIRVLPEESRTKSSDTPSKWAAKALLGDVYMTMAGWPLRLGTEYYAKAAAEFKDVIEKSGLKLESTYEGLWQEETKKTVKEHLFAIHNSVKEGRASQYGTSFYPADFVNGGWADYHADVAYMNTYPEGARKDFNYMLEWPNKQKVVVSWQESLNQLPCIAKFQNYDNGVPGKSAQSNGLTPIYRLADVYLMYAETSTLATNSVNALALKSLQDIQRRAGSAVVTTTTDPAAFDKAVFNEYGWEFLAEGSKRWFQLVRREKVAEIKPKEYASSLFMANAHYYFPIPAEEIKLTQGWQNNAGY